MSCSNPIKSSALTDVIDALRQGGLVVLLDNSAPTVTAYLFCAAASMSEENVSFMVNHGRGVVLGALAERRIKELGLPMMSSRPRDDSPDLTVGVEARHGVSTGISAADRARTLQMLATTRHPTLDLVTPGHIFPVRAKNGGVLVRSAAPEAAVDLLIMSGMIPVAALCQCLDENGELLEPAGIKALAENSKLPLLSVADVIRERLAREPILEQVAKAVLPVREIGEFTVYCFRSHVDGSEHVALVKGSLREATEDGSPVMARVQAENHLADLLGTDESSSRTRMKRALRKIAEAGCGVFVYVRHPQKSMLQEITNAPSGSSPAADPVSELREFGIGAQILNHLGAKRIKLLTSSNRDLSGIQAFQIEIVERISL